MDSNNSLLDLIRAEQERRKAPSHLVVWRFKGMTDEEMEVEIAARRRAEGLGPYVMITELFWNDPPKAQELVGGVLLQCPSARQAACLTSAPATGLAGAPFAPPPPPGMSLKTVFNALVQKQQPERFLFH